MQKFRCVGRREDSESLEVTFFYAKDMGDAIEKAESIFADIYCLRPCTDEEAKEYF